MKSLRNMNFNEVKSLYKDIFVNNFLISCSEFKKITSFYQVLYEKFLNWLKKGYKLKGGSFGRDSKSYGLNILYGWYLEKIFYIVLKSLSIVSNIELSGDDNIHKFCLINEKILIPGKKTTFPDFKVKMKTKTFFIELKSGVKNKFTVKKGNVTTLLESTIKYGIPTLIFMLDLKNKTYGIADFNYFVSKEPLPNSSMEGQLCYSFPKPSYSISKIKSLSFTRLLDESYKNSEEYKKIKIKVESTNTTYEKTVKKKLKLEDKIKQKKLLEIQIFKLKQKNKDIELSWDCLVKRIKKSKNQ